MKVTTINVQITKQPRQYEAVRLGIECSLDAGENEQDAIKVLNDELLARARRLGQNLAQAMLDNDVKKAAGLQLEAIRLIDALFSEVNPIPVKRALEFQKRDSGVLRRPLTRMEDAHAAVLEAEMKKYGAL